MADVQMTWILHAHRKPKSDKTMEYLNFLDLGVRYQLVSECRPDHTPKNQLYFYVNEAMSMSEHKAPTC